MLQTCSLWRAQARWWHLRGLISAVWKFWMFINIYFSVRQVRAMPQRESACLSVSCLSIRPKVPLSRRRRPHLQNHDLPWWPNFFRGDQDFGRQFFLAIFTSEMGLEQTKRKQIGISEAHGVGRCAADEEALIQGCFPLPRNYTAAGRAGGDLLLFARVIIDCCARKRRMGSWQVASERTEESERGAAESGRRKVAWINKKIETSGGWEAEGGYSPTVCLYHDSPNEPFAWCND